MQSYMHIRNNLVFIVSIWSIYFILYDYYHSTYSPLWVTCFGEALSIQLDVTLSISTRDKKELSFSSTSTLTDTHSNSYVDFWFIFSKPKQQSSGYSQSLLILILANNWVVLTYMMGLSKGNPRCLYMYGILFCWLH